MESIPRKGVFLPSASLDSGLIIDCLRALHIDYPSVKFTSICSDEKLGGFKVCFSDLDEAVVLKKKQLTMFDKKISIYPLTANLLVNGIPSRKTPLYERDVRDAILRKFGRVLSVKIESSNEWLVEIEVPEFKNLQVFERHIHSEFTVDLPNRNETLKLKFWCGHCGKSGHFRHECKVSSGSGSQPGENLQRKLESKTADSNQPINGRNNLSLEPTNIFAEKIGREEIMKGTWSNGNKKQYNAATASASSTTTENNGFLTEKDIKKESEALGAQRDAKDEKYSKTVNSIIPKIKDQQSIRNESYDGSRGTVNSDSNNDDDIQFLEVSLNTKGSTNLTSPDSNSTFTVGRGNTTDSSTSRFTDLPSGSSSGIPVPSSETYSSPLRPARGAEVTTILSERLQESINEACSKVGVLERQKLDAFLIHVKKKSNPIRVALNYTQNAKGLKDQLKQILFIYYNTPQTGTKEDIQFIKWLNGLVERFDGSIPRKRKRAGQSNDDESPIRKIK